MYFYDCYDENKKPITQIFANNYNEVKQKVPNCKWVLGFDVVYKETKWHDVDLYVRLENTFNKFLT